MRILASVVIACTLLVGSGSAQDYQPYPEARITKAQWQSYFDQVKGKFGSTEVHPSANLVEFHSSDTFYVFTEPGNTDDPEHLYRLTPSRVIPDRPRAVRGGIVGSAIGLNFPQVVQGNGRPSP